ncbi:hypothetical protein D9619_011998 [Psilocybe cf. subviscida]|uniref:DUF6534 domain-containing protein n=1 Tax=Psilocybe cf. subviscida TaxID=2480587 RepID=A0A8H5B0T0_9AGAR|nr:hypothetical protein D9619_011998 [Psilocybe cf. subviscida]
MADSDKAIESATFLVQASGNLGAMEIGTFVGLILYGVTVAQAYHYFTKHGSDPVHTKLMVFVLMFLETFHTFVAAYAVYLATVTHWSSERANSYPIAITVLLEGIITTMVQSFFIFRIHRLSGRTLAPAFFLLLTVARFGGLMATSVLSFLDVPKTPNGLVPHDDRALITADLVIGAVTDLLIAITLSYDLRQMFTKFTTARTAEALNRLIRLSLQTGIITSFVSFAILGTFTTMPNLVWLGLYIVSAKLYSVSMLIALNVRQLNRPLPGPTSKEPSCLVFANDQASTSNSTDCAQNDLKV